jgi:hypothetical protein
MPDTRSGRLTASTRAKWPPRLWTDDGDPLLVALGQHLHALLETADRRLGAVHVGADPGLARVVAGAPQPVGHRAQRVVTRQEAGNQQHGLALAVGDAFAVKDRVAAQARHLQTDEALPPDRRLRQKCGHFHRA